MVGFATAVDADLSRGSLVRGGGGADVAVPVAALVGVPVPVPGLDVGVGGGAETRSEVGVKGGVEGEVVIAVAYRAVALKRRSRRGEAGDEGEVAVGDQVYAKAKHLGFAGEEWVDGREDDGEDEDEDGEDAREPQDEFEVEDDELDLDDEAAVVEFDS